MMLWNDDTLGGDCEIFSDLESYLRYQEMDERLEALQNGIWKSATGDVNISDMTPNHISNVISMLDRQLDRQKNCSELSDILAKFGIPTLQAELSRRRLLA